MEWWTPGFKHPQHGVMVLAYKDGTYFFATSILGVWSCLTDSGDKEGPVTPDYWMPLPPPPTN